MRRLFSSKLFVFGFILAVLAAGIMLYAFISPSATPITNLLSAVITPVQQGASWVGDKIGGFFGYFKGQDALKTENGELKEKLAEYEKLEAQYYAALNENTELRRLAELKQKRSDFEFEMCSVTSSVMQGYRSGFTISKGSAAGIEKGDCVITESGFVGYVDTVNLTDCEIVTLVNVECRVAAVVSRTREVVVAEGSFDLAPDGTLKLAYLKNDADIKVGDMIETSGAGNTYPKGIVIGRVAEIKQEEHGLSSYAVIEPAVSLSDIHTVFVIKDFEIVE